ncbi:hypothetical protein PTSG_12213 [Salpingoeca rosetta]|uniref:RRM domain-containing protein n=1 Tax=Salpingoeca rosetta (strain ATCC 50818 / BSB-021) TaxID=946362 RepID=F2U9P3_SALR5|nr:uncharacterized protein PTSG_12213 [Salpingoeca rosetta]EGD73070.1 hypothetical protein PTSG_12213 [Salpingoeca rosetta]|eukprot:XP_004994101.1 hypothetical protein PTSG_12213 [Salpingoeca rosetta]
MPSRRQRKLRAAEGTRSGTDMSVATLFVRNLAFSVTAEDLENVFSDIGPVRQCFIVKTPQGGSRGFGYVLFGMREDAMEAQKQLDGHKLHGRPMSVQFARRKGAQGPAPAPRPKQEQEMQEMKYEEAEPMAKEVQQQEEHQQAKEEEEESEDDNDDDGDDDDDDYELDEDEKAMLPRRSVVAIKEEEDIKEEEEVGDEPELQAHSQVHAEDTKATKKDKKGKKDKKEKQQKKEKAVPREMTAEEKAAFEQREADRRTIVIKNLSRQTNKKKLFQKMRKYGTVKGITMVDKTTAHVTFTNTTDATTKFMRNIVLRLDQHELHGSTISVRLKSKQKAEIPEATKKDARLIVRNLDFSTTEDDLQRIFSRFGKLAETKIVKDDKGRSKGFGFVMLSNPLVVKKAVKQVNGRTLNGRAIAVDFALNKKEYEKKKQERSAQMAMKEEEEADVSDDDNADADVDDDDDDEESDSGDDDDEMDEDDDEDDEDEDEDDGYGVADGRTLFVDHIPTSVKTPRMVKLFHAFGETVYCRILRDHESGESRGRGFVKFKTKEAADACLEKAQTEGLSVGNQRLTIDRAKSRNETRVADATEGHTVFVRDMSLDSTHDDLKELMSQFGTVKYALLVKDKQTDLPRGTAFVRFSSKEEADACLEAASNPDAPLMLDTRQLAVSRALPKRDVEERQKERKEKPKVDRRNLYLLREGAIPTDHPAYASLSDADKQRRQRLELEGKEKAKNPNMAISKTRLTIHNIPLTVDEKQLKQIVRNTIGKVKITQVKIVRDEERPGPDGKPRSRGFGFIEFGKHEAALEALRKLNNSPSVFTKQRRPIVQFAWENALVLRALKEKMQRIKSRQEQLKKAALLNDDRLVIGEEGEEKETQQPVIKAGKNKRNKDKKDRKDRKDKKRGKGDESTGGDGGDDGENAAKKAKKSKKESKKESKKKGSGEQKPRRHRRMDELDAIAATVDTSGNTDGRSKPRRAAKKAEKAKEVAFDDMVAKYRKKLDQDDMMAKWM